MTGFTCPHCEEDIELEDGVSGVFKCPHCDQNFSWDDKTKFPLYRILGVIGIIGIFLVFLGTFGLWIMKPSFGGDEFAFSVGSLFIGTIALFLMMIIWIFHYCITMLSDSKFN